MNWWNNKKDLPLINENFIAILDGLLFNCPTSIRSRVTVGIGEDGKKKTKTIISPVSARANTFRKRGIKGQYLTAILYEIRKPLIANNAYYVVDKSHNVEVQMKHIIKTTALSDPNFDVIVMLKRDRNEMPETEAIYYYIRNALAHGSFEFVSQRNDVEAYYLLESKQKNTVKAQMRLKESTMLKLVALSKMTPIDIKHHQKAHKNNPK